MLGIPVSDTLRVFPAGRQPAFPERENARTSKKIGFFLSGPLKTLVLQRFMLYTFACSLRPHVFVL
jgi:hypothetical protein